MITITNVQLKSNGPWLVLDGTPREIAAQIGEVFPGLTGDGTFAGLVRAADGAWKGAIDGSGQAQAQPQTPAPGPFGGGQAQAQAQGGGSGGAPYRKTIGQASWGKSTVFNVPGAPTAPNGRPAVLHQFTSKAGKAISLWVQDDDKRATDDRNGQQHDWSEFPDRGFSLPAGV